MTAVQGKNREASDETAPTLALDEEAGQLRDGVPLRRGGVLPGGYRLEGRIGVGGMGEVWRGWCTRLHRPVAIKLLTLSGAQRGYGERLEREARALAALRHPAIVQVFDVGRDHAGRPHLVMELLRGEDLAHHVSRRGRLAATEAVALLLPVADALAAAHQRGIVHRDLKPDNVFVLDDSEYGTRVKLLDFGVARVGASSNLTRGLLGTPEYMAPEQIDLASHVTAAADQWSFGVTLFAVIAGRQPFTGDDPVDLFRQIRAAPLPFPREASMPPALFRILARATRKAPEDRFPSMDALGERLRRWLAGQPDLPPSPASEPPPRAPLDAAIRAAFEER